MQRIIIEILDGDVSCVSTDGETSIEVLIINKDENSLCVAASSRVSREESDRVSREIQEKMDSPDFTQIPPSAVLH